jgi:hypothetical protein
MLKDLDINEDDDLLPVASKDIDNQSQHNGENATQSTENASQKPSRGQKPAVENENIVMPSRYNHRIYRAFIRGKNDEAKRLIDVCFMCLFCICNL